RVELVAELFERARSGFDLRIERLHLVPVLLEALGHVGAHAAEADHAELHQMLLPVAGVMRWRAKSKHRKDAGSVRSRRLRALPRTPRGAALQPSARAAVGGGEA